MTDPGQRNEPDPTIGGDIEGVHDAPTVVPDDRVPEFDATLGLDDDDATVFPDESPETDAATVVTDDDDDDATVFPDDDQTVSPDMEPAATVVSDSVPATVVEPPIEDGLTVVPDESEDDDLTVYGDDDEPPRGNDDPTMVREEVPTQMIDGAPAPTVLESQALDSVSETSTDESQSGSKSRLSFVKGKGSKSKRGKAAEPKKSESEGPRYELVDNFAHGGMGNIWKANDQRIHRDVAYKELLPRALKRPRVVERFVQEAQITGQLEHPCIVPIYDLGNQESGAPFYVMKLIHGTEMKDVIEEMHKLSKESVEYKRMFIQLLRGLIDTCNAMAFAHERGVLHRDLKPQNVMLGGFGETLVLDWGLAKILGSHEAGGEGGVMVSGNYDDKFDADEEPSAESLGDLSEAANVTKIMDESPGLSLSPAQITATVQTDSRSEGTETKYGSVMGTPAYMPPEQAEGKLDLMDARTDIYSLGAILYEILTDDAPIPRGKMDQMLDHVKNKPIRPPIEIVPTTPRQLDAIALKALSKRREDRYTTALELARDIEDYLADEPVSAYPEPWYERIRRWVKRHRTLVTTSSAVVLVAILGSIAWSSWESARLNELQTIVESKMDEAKKLSGTGDFDEAKVLLNEADSLVEGEESLAAVDGLIEAAERDRLNAQTLDVEQELILIRDMIEARNELNDALAALTAIVTNLADEPDLTELHGRAEAKLNAVTQQIDAGQTLKQFHRLADLARQHASLFTGEQIVDDIREARQHASDAVDTYSLGEPWQSQPLHLSPEELQSIRVTGFELLLLLAEVELAEASLKTPPGTEPQTPDGNARHAEAALKWIEAAHGLGFQTRTLELRRAECLDQLGRDNARDVALSTAEQLQPSTRLDYFLQGEYERKAGRFDNAVAAYRQALRRDADDFWSMHFLGLCLYQQDEAAGAVSHLTACVAYRPDFVWTYLARALAFAELEDFDSAYADLAVAEEIEPDLYAIGVNRGGLLLKQNRLKEAVEQFERSAQLDESRYEPWLNLGIARREMAIAAETRRVPPEESRAIYQAAAHALEQAVQRGGGSRVFRVLGDVLRRTGNAQLALQQYSLAAGQEHDPKRRADDIRQAGSIFLAAGQLEEALQQYRIALGLDPDNGDLQRLYAETLIRAGRYKDAIKPLTRALELSGPNADAYRARGSVLAGLGNYREAMDDYTLSLQLEADAPNILTRRGWAYISRGNDLALSDFKRAVELNPENADSHNGLGYAQVLAGKVEEAVASARTAVQKAEPQLAAQGSTAWPLLYNAATVLAQATARVGETDADKYTVEAVELLRRAVGVAGADLEPVVRGNITTDTALNPIRRSAAFQKAFPADDETD